MRKNLLVRAVIISGILALSASAADYLVTDISKGNTWKYKKTEGSMFGPTLTITTSITDYSIDSIWGAAADTLLFSVSESDSIIKTTLNTNTSVLDTQLKTNSKTSLVCKKANRVTLCTSSMVSSMFSDKEIVYLNGNTFYYPARITVNAVQYDGLLLGKISGIGTHFGTSFDSSLFADKIGLLSESSNSGVSSGGTSSDFSIKLLRYNGKDVSYSYAVNPVSIMKSTSKQSTLVPASGVFKGVFNRNSLKPGFNLLGQQRVSSNSGFGMRIWRDAVKK